jgi:hypothetical protein
MRGRFLAERSDSHPFPGISMAKRRLQIIRSDYPVSGMCDQCRQVFISRNEKLDVAELHVMSQFEAHECNDKNGE